MTVVFGSCKSTTVQPNEENTGSLLFLISKEPVPEGSFRVVVLLERQGLPTRADSVNVSDESETEQLHMKNIQSGTWLISLSARDSAGVELDNTEALVDIQQGQVSVAEVTFLPITGELDIVIIWPNFATKWEISSNNPVLQQTPAGFDANHYYLAEGKVLKVGNEYKMWYTGGPSYVFVDTLAVYLATSADGINWTKAGPVVQRGQPGSWNDKGSINCTVLYEDGMYRMWFEGHSSFQSHNGIGYATSSDGISWNVSSERVFTPDSQRPRIFSPDIMKHGDTYYLYYSVELEPPPGALVEEVWLSTSTDALNWVDRGVVLRGRANVSWEYDGVHSTSTLYTGGRFEMYYTTGDQNGAYIGKALSSNGLNWTFPSNEPEIQPSDLLLWSVERVAYPSVLLENGKRKMWFSGMTSSPQWQIGYAEEQ